MLLLARCALVGLAIAQEPAPPPEAPRFELGARARLDLEQVLDLEVETVLESHIERATCRTSTKLRLRLEVLKAPPSGGATVAIAIESIDAEIEDQSGKTRWSSSDRRAVPADSPRADLLQELARLLDARLELDLDPHHRVLARRGTEIVAERLGIAPDGGAFHPPFPWLWVAWPRDGQREELELALPVDADGDSAAANSAPQKPSGPRIRAVLTRALDANAATPSVALEIAPLETRGAKGARRALEGRGRFTFDAKTGLLESGELETRGSASREGWLDLGRPLWVASKTSARSRLTWRRAGS